MRNMHAKKKKFVIIIYKWRSINLKNKYPNASIQDVINYVNNQKSTRKTEEL